MPNSSRSRRMAAVSAGLVLLGSAACTDDTAGPGAARAGQIAVAPDFGVLQPSIVDIARGRFMVARIPSGAIVKDTVIGIDPNADSVALAFSVPVLVPGETFSLAIRLIDAAGDTVFRAGPIAVRPTTSGSPVPVEVPFTYVGTGFNAKRVIIGTADTSTFTGEGVLLTAAAVDSTDTPIPGTPIGWTSLDTARVTITTDQQYRGVAVGATLRGVARLVATLVTGQQDTVLVDNQPLPATIVAESGIGQSGLADSMLPQPLGVRVTSTDGQGTRGIWVRFAVSANGGPLSADSVRTDSTGRTTVRYTMVRSFQPQVITATTARLSGQQATFTPTLTFAPPATLTVVAGDGQTAVVQTPVAVAPQVRVLDAQGLPIPNVAVTFSPILGGGLVTGATPVTDTLGLAAVTSWQMGPLAEPNVLRATADTLQVSFTATAIAGPATELRFTAQPTAVAQDSIMAPPVVVMAYDAFGNRASGFTGAVQLALAANPGGATLSGSTSVPAVAGIATFADLRLDAAGMGFTLLASATGLTPDTSDAFDVSATVRQIRWINATGGDWDTPTNWDAGRVPSAADSAVIDLAGSYLVTVTSATAAAANLRIGGAGSAPTLRISSNSSVAALTVVDGLTNAATIVLTDGTINASASLTVSAGVLVNTGTILSSANWGGGSRTLTATVDNQGTLGAQFPLTVINTGRTFTTAAGWLSAASTLTVSGGTVVFGSGTQFTGGGTVTLPAGTALQLASDFTFVDGNTTLDLAGEGAGITVSGPGALIVANRTRPLVLGTDTITTSVSIQDTLKIRAPTVMTGAVTVEAAGVLYLRATTLAELTVASGLTNAGAIVLHDDAINASASLAVTSGTLVNTGTIQSVAAWGGGSRTLTATVDNQGTVTVGYPLTVANTGRTLTTTAGTLTSTSTLTLSGGTVLFGSGTVLTGNGTIALPVGTALQLATDFTIASGSPTLDLAGEGAGITVSGPGALIVANPIRPLVLGTDTIAAPLSIQDTLKIRAPTVASGAVTVEAAGVLYLRATTLAALTAENGLTNAGTIVLHDEAINASAALTVTGGPVLTTGTIQTAAAWGGGTRTITADLDLRGTLDIGFPLTLVGQLISPLGASGTVNGNGSTLPVAGLDVDGITFDNTPVVSTGGTISRFDNVTFQNMNPSAVQLTINHPGAVTAFTFTGVSFLTTPSTGKYVRANDTDTGDGNPLTLEFTGATPPDGSAYEEELNGAVINWVVPAVFQVVFAGDSLYTLGPSTGVFTVNPDGTGLARPATTAPFGGVERFHPRWSPDRSRIAYGYEAAVAPSNRLYVMSADGNESAAVVTDTNTALARWSPDGVHLAFVCDGYDAQYTYLEDVCVINDVTGSVTALAGAGDGGGKIFISQLVGSADRQRGPSAFAWDPTNPDRLAFVRDSTEVGSGIRSSRIYTATYSAGSWSIQPLSDDVMDPGTGPIMVASAWLDWSTSGQLVFSAYDQSYQQDIYVINDDGSGLTQLTSTSDLDDDPLWAPDASEILFTRDQSCSFDAWLMNADGSNQRQVTAEGICDFNTTLLGYDWSPDGLNIVLTGFESPYSNLLIYKILRTTTAATYLSDRVLIGRGAGAPYQVRDIQPSWRP